MDNQRANLSNAWSEIWEKVSPEIGGFAVFLVFVAIVIAVWQIVSFILANRRQGGGSGSVRSLVVWLLVAGVLAAPAALIPLFLILADGIINLLIVVASLVG